MNAAMQLKALREELGLTVRQLAAEMGAPDVPNTYGYYESKAFTRETLQLDKARVIARAFDALHPGAGARVMSLTGLADDDVVREARALDAERPATLSLMMPVQFPSGSALTQMFEGLLEAADRPDLAAELAPQLAQHFPNALKRSLIPRSTPASGAAKYRDEAAQPSSTDRPVRR